MTAIFQPVIDFYMTHLNYGMIILLMTIESSFIPFPSEVIIPPAAWKAAGGELNIFLVILCGVIGSILGALFNYFLARTLGRVIVYKLADTKLAHLLLIDVEGVEKAEKYFNQYGNISTFIGRLIPAIRQLISIPAGLSKMNMPSFLFFTTLGSSIWTIILAVMGYFLYSQKERLELYYTELTYAMVVLGFIVGIYLAIKIYKSNQKKA